MKKLIFIFNIFLLCSCSNEYKENSSNDKNKPTEPIDSADIYFDSAFEKEKNGDYRGAVNDYNMVLKHTKDTGTNLMSSIGNRGVIKASIFKDYNGAIRDFTEAIRIRSNHRYSYALKNSLSGDYSNRAKVKQIIGDIEGACKDWKKAIDNADDEFKPRLDSIIQMYCN